MVALSFGKLSLGSCRGQNFNVTVTEAEVGSDGHTQGLGGERVQALSPQRVDAVRELASWLNLSSDSCKHRIRGAGKTCMSRWFAS